MNHAHVVKYGDWDKALEVASNGFAGPLSEHERVSVMRSWHIRLEWSRKGRAFVLSKARETLTRISRYIMDNREVLGEGNVAKLFSKTLIPLEGVFTSPKDPSILEEVVNIVEAAKEFHGYKGDLIESAQYIVWNLNSLKTCARIMEDIKHGHGIGEESHA